MLSEAIVFESISLTAVSQKQTQVDGSVSQYDAIIIGAGASGMMCALTAGYQGRRVLLLDHAPKAGAKIRISGGGKCNFTNRHVSPSHYHSQNPHFVTSALARYPSSQFIEWVERHGIEYEEREHGQLFTCRGAGEIIAMLRTECDWAGVSMRLNCHIERIQWQDGVYQLNTSFGRFHATALVIATGGLSYPKLKASAFGYRVAEQFGVSVIPPRPGLVGLKIGLADWAELAGISLTVGIGCRGHYWVRDLLFTHTGISGPAVLMVSNVWHSGLSISLNLFPHRDLVAELKQVKQENRSLKPWLRSQLPKRLADVYWQSFPLEGKTAEMSDQALRDWAEGLQAWQLTPSGTDGYAKAEVTLGGVDTADISSKTMEAKQQKGLYFIGEVLDVTGDLGGYNFQWAWASGFACGIAISLT